MFDPGNMALLLASEAKGVDEMEERVAGAIYYIGGKRFTEREVGRCWRSRGLPSRTKMISSAW